MHKFIKSLVIVLIVLYPFIIYFGLKYLSPSQIGLMLLLLFAVRAFLVRGENSVRARLIILTVIAGSILAGLAWFFGKTDSLLWYPVAINVVLFLVFTRSLVFPPTVIEMLARVTEGDLPEKAIRYTRKVTIVWSIFFVFNSLVAVWTVLYGGMQLWTLYNGLIAYILMGILFGVEFMIRRRVRGH